MRRRRKDSDSKSKKSKDSRSKSRSRSKSKSKSSDSKKKKKKRSGGSGGSGGSGDKSFSKTDVHPDERLCNTSKERKCRDDCFADQKCKSDNVLSGCHKECRYKCCDADSDDKKSKDDMAGALCDTSEEKMCRLKCFNNKSCDSSDEECRKECRMDCCSSKKSKDDDTDKSATDKDSDEDESKDDDDRKNYKPLEWSGLPDSCQDAVDRFNRCYENSSAKGEDCYDYNASRELDEIFEVATDNDPEDYDCEDWFSFVCSFREETTCCRNTIRNIGQCLSKEVFGHDEDECDDSCKGSGGGGVLSDKDKTVVELAVAADDEFSTLVELLQQFDLDSVLSGEGPFTVSIFGREDGIAVRILYNDTTLPIFLC